MSSPVGSRLLVRWGILLTALLAVATVAVLVLWPGERTAPGETGEPSRAPIAAERAAAIRRAAATRNAPPKFVTPARPPIVSPVDQLKARGLTLAQAFERERRDESWAGLVERGVAELVQSDLGQLSSDITFLIECRTTTCKLKWSAPPELAATVSTVLLRLYPGSGAGPTGPGEAVVIYRTPHANGETQTPEELLQALAAERAAKLDAIRTGKDPGALRRLPLEKWPE